MLSKSATGKALAPQSPGRRKKGYLRHAGAAIKPHQRRFRYLELAIMGVLDTYVLKTC